jgi:Domain of unknown function (DUF4271)
MVAAQTDSNTVIVKDSVPLKPVFGPKDSTQRVIPQKKLALHVKKDSMLSFPADSTVSKRAGTPAAKDPGLALGFRKMLLGNIFFNFLGLPFTEKEELHRVKSFDSLFYLLAAILFYFALVRVVFGKYMGNLFTLFFRVSMRQQQIREQVIQSPLPSLLLNIFFVISAGLYCCFLILYFKVPVRVDFWSLYLNCSLILVATYLVKFIVLKCVGWVFNIQRATDTYIFIVFMTNKILGIFLLPFLVTLSFSNTLTSEIAVTLSLVMTIFFFIRRFAISYGPIRKEIKVNGLHFFLYLCAFEVAPLLLIYKVLLSYLEKAY